MARAPRIAVIGGGVAGSLASLVLRNRGALPVVFDAGSRQPGGRVGGGRQPDSGVQVEGPVYSGRV
jgi:NADPH-dependent 2,4-dienoyl-CoA reductase/sulfur reductase-like enzyme